jgi:hypothetical protein
MVGSNNNFVSVVKKNFADSVSVYLSTNKMITCVTLIKKKKKNAN